MLMDKRIVVRAGWAALAAFVLVGTALVLWPEEQNPSPAGPPEPASPDPAPAEAAAVRPPPGPPAADPPVVVPPGAEDGGGTAPCDGCLTERAVLDVVETYLRHLDPTHLQGGLWAQPLADVAPETPGLVHGLPKLPPGLLEAPELNPFGVAVDTRRYPVETTWLVWLQTGWVPRRAIEQRIRRVRETTIGEIRTRATSPVQLAALETILEALEEAWPGRVIGDDFPLQESSGDLPEVALSWPPIKKETYVAVDARTGKLRPDGIFRLTSIGVQPEPPPHHERALDLARERAGHWLREASPRRGRTRTVLHRGVPQW